MAFVPGYDYDLFISYAHVDELEGWVSAFHKQLEVKLSSRIGRIGVVKIWRDRELDGSQLFDDVIFDRIRRSALFLSLCSPGYLESDYCRQELDGFHRGAGELAFAERSRIVHALLYNIPHQEWPEQFGRVTGFAFHNAEREEDFGDPLDPTDPVFRRRLLKLRNAIYELLSAMAEAAERPEPAADEPEALVDGAGAPDGAGDGGRGRIYLAGVSDGLRVTRQRLASELAGHGFAVEDAIPPPYAAARHDRAVTEAMTRADLAVHLFDDLGGAPVEGARTSTYPRRQLELGLDLELPQLVWVPRNLELATIEDPAQQEFLRALEEDPRAERGYDFIRGLPTALPREIEEMLKRRAPVAETPAAVLLDTHVKDQLVALETSRVLLEHNVQPYINPEEDDPRRNSTLLEERLKQVQALIIVYGQVEERWVRARLAEAIKVAISEGCPLKLCGVYLAPPDAGKAEVDFSLPWLDVHMLDNRDGFDPRTLEPILRGLREAA